MIGSGLPRRVVNRLRRAVLDVLRPPDDLVAFWDKYARDWAPSTDAATLGKEWKNEHGFVTALERALDDACAAGGAHTRALEIGAGGGRISAECMRLARGRLAELVLADSSDAMLEHCRRNIGAPRGVRYAKLSGGDLDAFGGASFELVYSHDVFVHFEDIDVFNYLRDVARVLKPRGVFLVSMQDPVRNFGYFRLVADGNRGTTPGARSCNRVRFIPEALVRACADDAGLTSASVEHEHFAVYRFEKR
jgi:SAM-dependent methyltransferase